MAQPPIDDAAALRVRAEIMALGGVLTDVTGGQTPDEVHRALLDLRFTPGHDARVSGVLANRWDFLAGWEALQYGADLPAAAWEGLVLPTIVAFSGSQAAKMHLELATTHWLAARAAVDEVADYPLVIAAVLAREAATSSEPAIRHEVPEAVAALPAAASMGPIDDPAATGRAVSRPWLIRGLVPSAAAVAIAATAAIMLQDGAAPGGGRSQPSPVTQPSGPQLSPAGTPAAVGPVASASPSMFGAPSPATAGSGQESGPSAGVTATTTADEATAAPSVQPSDPASPSAGPRPSNGTRPSPTQPAIPTPRHQRSTMDAAAAGL